MAEYPGLGTSEYFHDGRKFKVILEDPNLDHPEGIVGGVWEIQESGKLTFIRKYMALPSEDGVAVYNTLLNTVFRYTVDNPVNKPIF